MIRIYVRISSKSQHTRTQDADLKRWADGQHDVVWYRDKFTGTTMDRPAWSRLMADLTPGDVVCCWRLDRLGRTAAGLAKLFADLQERRINLVSLRDAIDLSTASGRLMAHVLASVAAYETEVRSERQMAGIRAAQAAGKRWGGRTKGQRVKVTSEQADVVRRLRDEGQSISAISRAVSLSRPTVYSLLAD
jgi:DNA invertase Pin-like site-specific DNA recombinase